MTIHDQAVEMTDRLIIDAVRHNGQRDLNPDWDVRSEVYGKEVGRVEQYMIAGNGPTAYVCFVIDADGDLDYAYLRYSSGGDDTIVSIDQFDGEDLYEQMRSYR